MTEKSKSGRHAILFSMNKGTLIEGDGLAALADNAWFQINTKAETSALPLRPEYFFKSPNSANAITPAVGDSVFPIDLTKICKGDTSVSPTKAAIDVTDDCEDGYNAYIPDGFTDLTGSVSAFLKFNTPGGGMASSQIEYLSRFFSIVDDDGSGTYTLTDKNDDDLLLAILQNGDQLEVGDIQVWLLVPVILTAITLEKPLKGAQTFNFDWSKAQGPAAVYNRQTNVAGGF